MSAFGESIMMNAGQFNRRINIYQTTVVKDAQGFQTKQRALVLQTYAYIKTTRGMTIIKNNSDFEKAYTNFTIRFPHTQITRDMEIEYNGKIYEIQYLNNVDEANVVLEIQAKEVTH